LEKTQKNAIGHFIRRNKNENFFSNISPPVFSKVWRRRRMGKWVSSKCIDISYIDILRL
jgi:hypothetical protein